MKRCSHIKIGNEEFNSVQIEGKKGKIESELLYRAAVRQGVIVVQECDLRNDEEEVKWTRAYPVSSLVVIHFENDDPEEEEEGGVELFFPETDDGGVDDDYDM